LIILFKVYQRGLFKNASEAVRVGLRHLEEENKFIALKEAIQQVKEK
jgi:Arc/MetJ-type ribon-helix-helix transcriptional regulator